MATHTIEDYKHYYEGCFGVNPKGNIVFVSEVHATPKKHMFELRGSLAHNNSWYPFKGLSEEISYPMPQMGYINLYDSVLLVKRIPARQWKRGLYKGAFDIETPAIVAEVDRHGIHEIRNVRKDSLEVIQNIIHRTYASPEAAIRDITTGNAMAVAVSPSMMMCITHTDKIALWHTGGLIGWIYGNKIYLEKGAWMFKEEVQQVFRTFEVIKYG